MEREEIIKALEQIQSHGKSTAYNAFTTITNALSLIKELTKEADNYKAVAEKQQSISMDRHFEIKRLAEENEKLTINMNAYGLTAKRLAEENAEQDKAIINALNRIKEVRQETKADTAKYLIDRIKGYYEVHKGRIRTASLIYYIEQIAKEMTEDKNE